MTNEIAVNLFGIIRLVAKQHHNFKWKVTLQNRQLNNNNELFRSVSSGELKMLLDYTVSYLGQPRQNITEKELSNKLKLIIKHHRHEKETQVPILS